MESTKQTTKYAGLRASYEREGWPGMYLSRENWHWFDAQDYETQRDYHRWMTREERVEA